MQKRDVINFIRDRAPESLALEWDNVGLQVGGQEEPLTGVALALTANTANIRQAIALGANLLITHHPPLFKPMKRIDPTTPQGLKVALALKHDLTIYSAHTNLDVVTPGVGHALAERLGLEAIAVLQKTAQTGLLKLVTFVPPDHTFAVLQALSQAGAGHIGAYDQCSFRVAGTGTFRPLEGADPYSGTVGTLSQEREERLEVILPEALEKPVVEALNAAHPYEEVAYDLIPLRNAGEVRGLGRIGSWPAPIPLAQAVERVKAALQVPHLRYVGKPDQLVRRVAVCGGSGGDLMTIAKQQGADLLVTGDIRFHTADEAREVGFAIIDAGHEWTEIPALELLDGWVREVVGERAPVHLIRPEDPFRFS